MTVITKPIIDKKIDKLDQPLVPGEVLVSKDYSFICLSIQNKIANLAY